MNIDDLYSNSLNDYRKKSETGEWEMLSRRVKRGNFLSFSFVRMNVYYVLLFFSVTAFAGYSTVRTMLLERKVETLNQTVSAYKRSLNSMKAKHAAPAFIMKDTLGLSVGIVKQVMPAPKQNVMNNVKQLIPATAKADTIRSVDTGKTKTQVSIHKIKKTIYLKPKVFVSRDTLKGSEK